MLQAPLATTPSPRSKKPARFLATALAFIVILFVSVTSAAAQASVKSISPAIGPLSGGNTIRVFGTAFTRNTTVWIWANQARVAKFVSSSEVDVIAPPMNMADKVDVAVFNCQGGSSARLVNSYTYSVNATSAPTPVPSTLTLNPSTVTGGTSSTGKVTLSAAAPSGGTVVTLSRNNAAATVPASVTVAAGQTSASFTVATVSGSNATATISASANGTTASGTLTVQTSVTPVPSALTLSPSTVTGGTSSTGTVKLTAAAPSGGTIVTLSRNNAAATVPASVTVAAGQTSASFTVTTVSGSSATATISASANGATVSGTLTVQAPAAPPALSALTLSPSTVTGGTSSTGTVTLTAAAPSGGTVVTLSRNNTAATVPASVTVAAGQNSASFTVATVSGSNATAIISASENGTTASSALTIQPTLTSTGTPLSACTDITTSGAYYLSTDLTSSNTCFRIDADNVDLNLNGHTLTVTGADAIVACDNWTAGCSANGTGHHANSHIHNGTITGGSALSSQIHYYGANGLRGGEVDHVTFNIAADGQQAIVRDSGGDGWKIHDNVVNSTVKNIVPSGGNYLHARYTFGGYAFVENGGQNISSTVGNAYSNNTLNGVIQGGIMDAYQHTTYDKTTCVMGSVSGGPAVTNDYCVLMIADNQTVTNSVVTGRGRGIDAEANNSVISNNKINVYEDTTNFEYGGCEISGGFGIRAKYQPADNVAPGLITIDSNDITVDASHGCDAAALRFTDLPGVTKVVVTNNTLHTIPGGNQHDSGWSLSGTDKPTFAASGNTYSGSTAVFVDWDGANVVIPAGNTWNNTQYGVYDFNGYLGGGTTSGATGLPFLQSVTISDTPAIRTVYCTSNAGGTVTISGVTTTCN